MCLASENFLVARPSWPCLHGLEARATLGNHLTGYMAKHILKKIQQTVLIIKEQVYDNRK